MLAQARPKKQAAIDEYCQKLRLDLVEAQPAIFAGPNPWVALDSSPGKLFDGQLAYVYYEGSRPRLLVLLMRGPRHEWLQTVSYFYGPDGLLLKRERYLEQTLANSALEESLYYENGRMFSRSSKDHALNGGHEDNSLFNDHDAPEFASTDDLPFPAGGESGEVGVVKRPALDPDPRSSRLHPPSRWKAGLARA